MHIIENLQNEYIELSHTTMTLKYDIDSYNKKKRNIISVIFQGLKKK